MPSGGDSSKCVQVGATVFKSNLELPGYLDDPLDKVILIFSRIVELAMACADADGVSDVREKKVILGWIEEWSRRMAGEGAECEARFRVALQAVFSSPRRNTFTLESAVFALHSYAEGQRMEALALCVRVIASDGVLHEKEMRLAEKLADLLQIDRSIMQALFDKQFANSGIVVSPDNLEAIVGVDPSWDKGRILKHLSEQFMKWNSRAPSARTVEEQARTRAMLDAIAKLRQKYA
jgi:tellurite resistance protein